MVATNEDGQVIVTLRLRFRPDAIERVLDRMLPIARRTREEEGNIAFDVFRAKDREAELVVFERWADHAALERHWALDYTREILALFEESLERPLAEHEDVTYLQDLLA